MGDSFLFRGRLFGKSSFDRYITIVVYYYGFIKSNRTI